MGLQTQEFNTEAQRMRRWEYRKQKTCPFVQFWARNSALDRETSRRTLPYYLPTGSAGEI
jgi:hypothetical protein